MIQLGKIRKCLFSEKRGKGLKCLTYKIPKQISNKLNGVLN